MPRLSQTEAAGVVDRSAGRIATADSDLTRVLALRNHALVEVLYGSGLRRQEACDLTLAGVDFENETMRVVGKGGKARTVPLTEPADRCPARMVGRGRPVLSAGSP